MPFDCTIDTKLRWFQYRLCHRILGTNYLLNEINKEQSPKCTFCNTEEETLSHLFFDCNKIITLWEELKTWILQKTKNLFEFTKITILLCFLERHSNILNFTTLVTKYHLQKQELYEHNIHRRNNKVGQGP
jgi:hypothetical protein